MWGNGGVTDGGVTYGGGGVGAVGVYLVWKKRPPRTVFEFHLLCVALDNLMWRMHEAR